MKFKPKYRVYFALQMWHVCASHDGRRRKPFITADTLRGALTKLAARHRKLMQAH